MLRSTVWTVPVVATVVVAPAFAASPTALTFTLTRLGADLVRITVTGGRNGLAIRLGNLGILSYQGIEGVTKTFAGGTAVFDQTGGTGFYIGGYSYSLTFTYDGTDASIAIPGGGSTTRTV